jgi:hypothetical protein
MNRLCASARTLFLGLLILAVSGGAVMAIEEPAFEVVEKAGEIEIRAYRPFIVAETVVEGEMNTASSAGFRLIADYIFGNNQSVRSAADKVSEKIAMTAPVTMAPVASSEKIAMTAPVTMAPVASSEKIAMTAPVTMEPQASPGDATMQANKWRVHFVMPGQYAMATLPKPNNSAVSLREIPAKRYAVMSFSGLAGSEKVQQKTDELRAWLGTRKITAVAAPQLARYDPPWTLPMFRRNEILIEIAAP